MAVRGKQINSFNFLNYFPPIPPMQAQTMWDDGEKCQTPESGNQTGRGGGCRIQSRDGCKPAACTLSTDGGGFRNAITDAFGVREMHIAHGESKRGGGGGLSWSLTFAMELQIRTAKMCEIWSASNESSPWVTVEHCKCIE